MVEQETASLSSADGYFIVGVNPPDAKIEIWRGEIVDGKFRPAMPDVFNAPAFMGPGRDGFAVGKAPAGSLLGITGVGADSIGILFFPCGSLQTITFPNVAGKIVYITSLSVAPASNLRSAGVSHGQQDIAQVREYLRSHYPSLSEGLVQGHLQMMTADTTTLPSLRNCGR